MQGHDSKTTASDVCVTCGETKPKAEFFIKARLGPNPDLDPDPDSDHSCIKAWRRPVGTRECSSCVRLRSRGTAPAGPKEAHYAAEAREGPDSASSKIRPNNWGYLTYVDKVFGLDCFKELVRLGIFESAKDISESMGALQACARHGFGDTRQLGAQGGTAAEGKTTQEQCRRPRVLAVNIGDGQRPHTEVVS